MGIFGNRQSGKKGFTVVELLIVVVVIAVLAGIVTVAYPSYQMRMRNNERKNDLSQLATALNTYALQKNNYMADGSGCGFLGTGNGWATLTNPGWYDKSVTKCLEEAGLLATADTILDPSGCRSDSGGKCGSYPSSPAATAYMKANCMTGGKPAVYVMAHLEGEPRKDAEVDALCDTGTLSMFSDTSKRWGTNYGMNYYVKVQ